MYWPMSCKLNLVYDFRWRWWCVILMISALYINRLRYCRGRVDGAIHRAAGPGLYEECLFSMLTNARQYLIGICTGCALPKIASDTMIRCQTGDARITKAYNLPSYVSRCSEISVTNCVLYHDIRQHVIHTVGPIYSSSNVETKAEQLASCYRTSLQLAVANSLTHIVSLNVKSNPPLT
jgi:O-acetyl-ADP-ribose deacetylase